jgi:hypothetical protein
LRQRHAGGIHRRNSAGGWPETQFIGKAANVMLTISFPLSLLSPLGLTSELKNVSSTTMGLWNAICCTLSILFFIVFFDSYLAAHLI